MSNLILKSPAKLNLYLKITKKYPNGFHELDTAFQLIDLCDVLEFDSSATNVSISCNDNSIKEHENIVYKVVMAMKERDKKNNGISINIIKNIPVGSGLGGGSSNAATTILALNKLWGLRLSNTELLSIGRSIGADIPFFIEGQNAYAKGIGDIFINKDAISEKLVIIDPKIFNSSGKMFEKYDSRKIDNYIDNGFLQNSFWQIFMDENPDILNFYKKNINDFDICLSGSGSSMFIKYNNDNEMEKILKIIPTNWRFFLAKPLQYSPLREFV